MYEPKNFRGALRRMARVVRRVAGGEILLLYITESGARQSQHVETALESEGVHTHPYLLLESNPEITAERGYKTFDRVARRKGDGYVVVDPVDIGKLGVPTGLGWDDIATQYRHITGSLLYLASIKSQLGLRQFMLGLDKEMNTPPLAHMSIDPFSDTVRFGDPRELLRKIRELAPKASKQYGEELSDLLFDKLPDELVPGYRIGPHHIERLPLLRAS